MNAVAFELGNRMGLPFTNHATHVELVLNGVYEGNYVLTEQVQVGEGRVEIDEDDGFLIEADLHYDEEPRFKSAYYKLPVMIKSPEDLTDPGGYDFVKSYINQLDMALRSSMFPENGYRELIDMDTFVKFLLINEIVNNTELRHPYSVYMYKDKGDAKISMGPLWDFDRTFGFSKPLGPYFLAPNGRTPLHIFFRPFFSDPVFRAKYKETWNHYYNDTLVISGMASFIDEMGIRLQRSYKANYTVWQWSNHMNPKNEIAGMKRWWNKRTAYLNTEINKY
jgi:spore coat protein CotH